MTTRDLTRGPDVYGPAEARELLGISRARFYQLQANKDFPAGRTLESGTVWDGPEMRAYDRDRRNKRPDAVNAAAILKAYRAIGAVKTTAKALGVDAKTVRAVLREIREPLRHEGPKLKAGAGASVR